MSEQPGAPSLKHVEAAAETVVQDVVTWVRGHPAYGHIVEQLGMQAIQAIAASAGIAL